MINTYGNRNVSMILENMRRLMNEDDASSNSTEIDIKDAIPVMVKGEGKLNVIVEIGIPSYSVAQGFSRESPTCKSITIYPSDEDWSSQTLFSLDNHKSLEISYTCKLSFEAGSRDNVSKDKEIFGDFKDRLTQIDGWLEGVRGLDDKTIKSMENDMFHDRDLKDAIKNMVLSKYDEYFNNNFQDEAEQIENDIQSRFQDKIENKNAQINNDYLNRIDSFTGWSDLIGAPAGIVQEYIKRLNDKIGSIASHTPTGEIDDLTNATPESGELTIKISGNMLIGNLYCSSYDNQISGIEALKIISAKIEQASSKEENIIEITNENLNEASFSVYLNVYKGEDGQFSTSEEKIPCHVKIEDNILSKDDHRIYHVVDVNILWNDPERTNFRPALESCGILTNMPPKNYGKPRNMPGHSNGLGNRDWADDDDPFDVLRHD